MVNNRFYYKIRVPVDLRPHFPCDFIKKSLKTGELQSAKLLLVSMEYKIHRGFTMLRSGMLTDDLVKQVVGNLLPSKQKKVEVAAVKDKVLTEVIKKYTEVKESGWTAKTKMEFKSVFRLLVDVLGDIEIKSITKPVVMELRSTLQKLPPNIYKKYAGKTVKQVLALKDVEPFGTKSVNKHVSKLGTLLRYCVDEGIINSNPASGMKISDKKRADEERNAYSKKDVAKIISSLPRKPSTPEQYWIPMIGLYSGMRLNEICQLYVTDIILFEGLWCFSINGEKDKRLKNVASERVIPIHPVLVELGLLDYVENIRNSNNPRLWMNLGWTDITGYGNSFCKWYQRFNRIKVTDDPKKVFHSMRHLVTDTLKQAGVLETVIAELVGHSNGGSMTMGRYGKRYQPKVLLEAMMKLDYEVMPTG
jgi:integrase